MPLTQKKFRIVNEGFACENCGRDVPPTAQTTPRNHCPFCLWSRHVDINPGDRANPCQGMMKPIGIYTHARKKYVVLHQCVKCGQKTKSKAIIRDKNATDSSDLIIEFSNRPIDEKRSISTNKSKGKRSK